MASKKSKKNIQAKSSLLSYYVILAAVTFAVYANSLNNDFVFDDDSVVLGDPSIESLSNIPNFFTGEMGFHKVIGAYYRPVVSSSYAIDYAVWGFKPFGFHLTNVIMHVINTLLFFALLRLMFAKSDSKFKDIAVFIAALIFGVHPVHTEVTAWVSGRTDGLSCTFFFAAFIFYLKYSRSLNEEDEAKNLSRYFLLTVLMYMLALFSKEMAITLPAVILLYDFIVNRFSREAFRQRAVMYLTLAVVSGLFILLRWYVLSKVTPRESYLYFYGKDFATVIWTMLQTVPVYFRLAVAPYGMLYHYSGYMPYQSSPFNFSVMFALIFILICLAAAFLLYKKSNRLSYPAYIAFAVVLFFVTVSPVMNIVPTMNFMGERFLYIPSMFLSIITAAVILKYTQEKNLNLIYGVSAVVLIAYGYMTVMRNADWKDNDTLFLSAEGRPGTVVYVNLGNIYAKKGEYDIAETYYRKALDLRSETVLANTNLGKIFMIKNNFDSAYYYIYKSHLLDTLSPEPMYSLGQLYANFDKIPEAVAWLEKMHTVVPRYMNSQEMLQQLKASQQVMQQQDIAGDTTLQQDAKGKIIQLETMSYRNYQDKKFDLAIEQLRKLIDINPVMAPGYWNNIGMCFLDQGKYSEAIEAFTEAVKIKPDFSTGYNNLGQSYEKTGNRSKALEYYTKAFETDPNNVIAKQNVERLR